MQICLNVEVFLRNFLSLVLFAVEFCLLCSRILLVFIIALSFEKSKWQARRREMNIFDFFILESWSARSGDRQQNRPGSQEARGWNKPMLVARRNSMKSSIVHTARCLQRPAIKFSDFVLSVLSVFGFKVI